MDTGTANQVNVAEQIAHIKAHMPDVYRAIQDKADDVGKVAYSLVRRGLRGEANCFYAFEQRGTSAGRLVGTPFGLPAITDVVAGGMVRFGALMWVMWGPLPVQQGGSNGAH